jgi:hypothetical protein
MAGWIAIALLTLQPHPDDAAQIVDLSLSCLFCGEYGGQDVVLNVLLFVPLGIGLGLWQIPLRRAIAAVALTTLFVETMQLAFLAGRDASLSDLVTNTVGGIIGIAAGRSWRSLLLPAPTRAWRLASVAGLAWLFVLSATGVLLQIRLPDTVYFGQWAPELGQFAKFPGTVVSATLNGVPLPAARLTDSPRVRAMLESDSVTLIVNAVAGARTEKIAPIVSIFDEHQQEILVLGQWGNDLVFRIRSRASGLLLREPALALRGVFAGTPADTLTLRASLEHGRLWLRAMHKGAGPRLRASERSPGWGWALLIPGNLAFGRETRLLTAVWLGGLILPMAYWLQRTHSRGIAMLVLTAVIGAGLGGLPLLLRMPPMDLLAWTGAFAGAIAGVTLARSVDAVLSAEPGRARPRLAQEA